jgi:hypothetical protein
MHPGNDVFAINTDIGVFPGAQGRMQNGAAFRRLIASPANIASRLASTSALGKFGKKPIVSSLTAHLEKSIRRSSRPAANRMARPGSAAKAARKSLTAASLYDEISVWKWRCGRSGSTAGPP